MIDVTLLGTAALLPIPDRALTAAVITCAGRSILLDCGEGTQTAARKAGVSLMTADVIALTHYHGDHIFGLPGLLQTMFCMNRTSPLTLIGPPPVGQALAPILELTGWLPFPLSLMELPPEGIALHALNPRWPLEARLTAFSTEHRVVSQGYAFTLGRPPAFLPEKAKALGVPVQLWKTLQHGSPVTVDGKTIAPEAVLGPARKGLKVVFSGDTIACDSLTDAAWEADLFICEGTYGENDQAQTALEHGHMNFAQAGRVAADARVKRLWLAHYSQMIENPQDFLPNAQACYPDAVCGEDGMRITLKFSED